MELRAEKLYVCQFGTELHLMNRMEVDNAIRDAEENYEDMNFTTLGSLNTSETSVGLKPYLLTYKLDNSIIYDVITAEDEEKAKEKMLSKKRFQKQRAKIEIKNVKNLSELVKQYYE